MSSTRKPGRLVADRRYAGKPAQAAPKKAAPKPKKAPRKRGPRGPRGPLVYFLPFNIACISFASFLEIGCLDVLIAWSTASLLYVVM